MAILCWQESQEGILAKDVFGGRLNTDYIAERFGHSSFCDVRQLDAQASGIHTVDLAGADQFPSLTRHQTFICTLFLLECAGVILYL